MRTALIALALVSALVMISCSVDESDDGAIVFPSATVYVSGGDAVITQVAQRVLTGGSATTFAVNERIGDPNGDGYEIPDNGSNLPPTGFPIEADNITSNCIVSANPNIDIPATFNIKVVNNPNMPASIQTTDAMITKYEYNGVKYNTSITVQSDNATELFRVGPTAVSSIIQNIRIDVGCDGVGACGNKRRPARNYYAGSSSARSEVRITLVKDGQSVEVKRNFTIFFNDNPTSNDCSVVTSAAF